MKGINFGRVLLGGLVAGAVLNFFEFLLNGVVLRSQMEADFKRMNLTPPGAGFMAYAVVGTFIFGIVAVLLYAIIRTRVGPGPRTAILTAIILWFCLYVYAGVINMMLINVPWNVILMIMGWGVVEYSLGLLAGASLYKEE